MMRPSKRDDNKRPYLMTNGAVLLPKSLNFPFYHLAIRTIGCCRISVLIELLICIVIFILSFLICFVINHVPEEQADR